MGGRHWGYTYLNFEFTKFKFDEIKDKKVKVIGYLLGVEEPVHKPESNYYIRLNKLIKNRLVITEIEGYAPKCCYREYTEEELKRFEKELENLLQIEEALKQNADAFNRGNKVVYIEKWSFYCAETMGDCYQYHLNNIQKDILEYKRKLKEKHTAEKMCYWLEDK